VLPDADRRLKEALNISAPAVSLRAIHTRARASANRERFQRSFLSVIAAVVLALSIAGTAKRATTNQATPTILPLPAMPAPLASATPRRPLPTPAPAPTLG